LVNYTDGLLDHETPGLKDWEEADLINFVRLNGTKKPDKFNKLLFDYINNDVKGTPIDDVTLLTLLFN
jgi:serine phosphatase RsbU (regulator of sigma subunit)